MKKWLKKLVAFYNKSLFNKKGLLGKKCVIGSRAKLINKSGKNDNAVLGNHVTFLGILDIGRHGRIVIGDNSVIRYATQIRSAEKITIGSEVIIANNVYICDHDSHPTDPQKRIEMCKEDHEGPLWDWYHAKRAPIIIEDNVWIGRFVTIMKGVTIGKGAIIASNAVVTKDVPPYSLCYGNPGLIKNGIYQQ